MQWSANQALDGACWGTEPMARHDLLLVLTLPDGRRVGRGATITLTPGTGWGPGPFELQVNPVGSVWLFLGDLSHIPKNPPTTESKWSYVANYTDPTGIGWIGTGGFDLVVATGKLIRPKHNSTIEIVTQRVPAPLPYLGIDKSTVQAISGTEGGPLVLNDLDEMLTAVRIALPSSTLAMAGKGLEGFLRMKGRSEDWWKKKLNGLSIGRLLADPDVEAVVTRRIGEGAWGRLRGSSVYVRNQGVHNNESSVTAAEAISAAEIVLHVVNSWPPPRVRAHRARPGPSHPPTTSAQTTGT